jgi:hypothetical protein
VLNVGKTVTQQGKMAGSMFEVFNNGCMKTVQFMQPNSLIAEGKL